MSVSSGGPRPPVPGEEGGSNAAPSDWLKEGGSRAAPSDWLEARRRCDVGLEPEGSACPDVPYETLLTLLEDRDGTALFLRFLRTRGRGALLEFWFACNGFRKIPEDDTARRLKLAKAIYRCYLCEGAVSRELTAEIGPSVRDAIRQRALTHGLFTAAHTRVQEVLQDTLFPEFLRAHTTRSPGDRTTPSQRVELEKETRPLLTATENRSHLCLGHTHKTLGNQATPSQRAEPEKETRPLHSTAEESRQCHQHRRARQRHTHLPHTPVKATTHMFAAELTRRLQKLQTQTQFPRRGEETYTNSAASSWRRTADSEMSAAHTHRCVTVVYSYDADVIPYRTCVRRDPAVTLGLFRTLLTRRGSFRFFFKTASAEFECGAVFQEIREDESVLPTFQQKIVARVERVTHESTAVSSPSLTSSDSSAGSRGSFKHLTVCESGEIYSRKISENEHTERQVFESA